MLAVLHRSRARDDGRVDTNSVDLSWVDSGLVSGGSTAAFRVAVGVIGAISCLRFLVHGWVTAFWTAPRHHFHWPGLWWVRPLPAGWMHLLVAAIGVCFAIAAFRAATGRPSRGALLLATFGFLYLGTIDIAPYLNHYVLLVIAGSIAGVVSEGRRVPAWTVNALRAVVATTYFWAAVAKVDADWLSGRTMRPWLATHVDWPLVGSALRYPLPSLVLSWCGLLFDAAIVPSLLWRRTRRPAFVVLVVFHVATAMLFPIGMFPWLMIGLSTIFFRPDWCDRWWPGRRVQRSRSPLVPTRAVVVVIALLAIVPVRGYLTDVGWSESGGRFAWRVMASNKVGVAELYVEPMDGSQPFVVEPARDLTALQAQQVAWQPDLILQWAHIVAADERARLGVDVEVHADVWVSVNGAAPRQLVDPQVDLAAQHWTPWRFSWVLPG